MKAKSLGKFSAVGLVGALVLSGIATRTASADRGDGYWLITGTYSGTETSSMDDGDINNAKSVFEAPQSLDSVGESYGVYDDGESLDLSTVTPTELALYSGSSAVAFQTNLDVNSDQGYEPAQSQAGSELQMTLTVQWMPRSGDWTDNPPPLGDITLQRVISARIAGEVGGACSGYIDDFYASWDADTSVDGIPTWSDSYDTAFTIPQSTPGYATETFTISDLSNSTDYLSGMPWQSGSSTIQFTVLVSPPFTS